MKSILTQSALDALCKKIHILDTVHPELPGPNDKIHNSPTDRFVFLHSPCGSTKVRIGEREVREREVLLLQLTRDRVVLLANVNDQGNQHEVVQDEGVHIVNEESGDATIADQPKRIRKKRKAADGAGGSGLPPKKFREDHGTSDTGASVGGNLWLRFRVYWKAVPCLSRSSVPHPLMLTAAVITTIVADATSALAPKAGTEPVPRSIFRDSASTGEANQDVVGLSHPVGTELSADSIFMSQDLLTTWLPLCFSPSSATWTMSNYLLNLMSERPVRHALAPKKKDDKIASLKAQLSLKEVEAAEAICLRGQVATVEAAEAARASELSVLKERNSALEEEKGALESKVAVLESADATKVAKLASLTAQVAKLTKDLSELGLSCDGLSIKASSLEVEKDGLVGQVSSQEGICFGLCDQVMGYKLFKEQIEVVQDEQVKMLSDKVAGIDADLMGMALHLDEEFYP
ncbi:hypothetical protein Tco_1533121 [Tanacetum coccineum]